MSARDQKWNVEEVSAFVFVVSPSNSKVQHLYTRATLLYIIRSTERLLLLYVQNIYVRMRDLAVHTYSRNLFQNALADSKNSQPYTFYILVQQYTCLSVCLAILFYFFMSNIRTHITERWVDCHQNEEGSKHTSTCQGARHRPFTVRTYICISYVYSSSVHFVVQPAKEGTGKRAVVDATCQPVLLYVLTGFPPWPRMKALTMFDEPSAAFASALLFLFSAFDAAAVGGGAAGGADCACEASAGAAAVELRLGGGISLITFSMSSAYSTSSSVPS